MKEECGRRDQGYRSTVFRLSEQKPSSWRCVTSRSGCQTCPPSRKAGRRAFTRRIHSALPAEFGLCMRAVFVTAGWGESLARLRPQTTETETILKSLLDSQSSHSNKTVCRLYWLGTFDDRGVSWIIDECHDRVAGHSKRS